MFSSATDYSWIYSLVRQVLMRPVFWCYRLWFNQFGFGATSFLVLQTSLYHNMIIIPLFLDSQIPRLPIVHIFRLPLLRFLDIQMPSWPDCYPWYPNSQWIRLPVIKSSRYPDTYIPRYSDSKLSRYPNGQDTHFPDSRIPRFSFAQILRCLNSKIPSFLDSQIPCLPDFQLPKFTDTQVLRSTNAYISRCPVAQIPRCIVARIPRCLVN